MFNILLCLKTGKTLKSNLVLNENQLMSDPKDRQKTFFYFQQIKTTMACQFQVSINLHTLQHLSDIDISFR